MRALALGMILLMGSSTTAQDGGTTHRWGPVTFTVPADWTADDFGSRLDVSRNVQSPNPQSVSLLVMPTLRRVPHTLKNVANGYAKELRERGPDVTVKIGSAKIGKNGIPAVTVTMVDGKERETGILFTAGKQVLLVTAVYDAEDEHVVQSAFQTVRRSIVLGTGILPQPIER